MDVIIPAKSSFTFNEVSSITDVKPYVLRFWESEFPQVDPVTTDNGERIYDLTDLHAVIKIKKLLFEEKFSIPKAKLKLMEELIEVPELVPAIEGETKISNIPSFVFEPPEETSLEDRSDNSDVSDYQEVKAILLAAQAKITTIKQNMSWS
ncbi:MerR family transcriptional regulator [Bacteriovoracaceae bacterium]|nr:MerR family transcriptional regulator [Bacteriovoracaceae bacterium]